jgi:hypothetical protein
MSNKIEQLNVAQIPVTNGGDDARFGDLIFVSGYLGTVSEFEDLTVANTKGLPAGATGMIDISSDRIISTDQIAASQTFTVQTNCYFDTITRAITDSADTNTVPCGYITEKMSDTALKIKLLPQDGTLTAV